MTVCVRASQCVRIRHYYYCARAVGGENFLAKRVEFGLEYQPRGSALSLMDRKIRVISLNGEEKRGKVLLLLLVLPPTLQFV